MKRLLVLFCTASALTAQAQPVINASDMPANGDVLTLWSMDTVGVDPGPSGANVTWDFSWVQGQDSVTTYYVPAQATPFTDTFPSANLASYSDTISYNYWQQGGADLQMLGTAMDSGAIVFHNPLTYFTFPFTYMSTYTDSFAASGSISSITFDQWGHVSMEADGYGTLITPKGTFPNVLRVRRMIADTMTFFFMVSIDTIEMYEWYQPGIRSPLLTVTKQRTFETGSSVADSSTTITYLNVEPNSVANLVKSSSLSLVPNPAGSHVSISGLSQKAIYNITDMTGRKVRTGELSPGQALNISSLADGFYIIVVIEDKTVRQAILQVQR